MRQFDRTEQGNSEYPMADSKLPDPFSQSTKPDRLQVFQRQLILLVLSLVALVLLIQVGFYFADIIRILAFSILFSYLFINVVDYLEKVFHNRAAAIMVVYLILAVAILVGMVLVFPAVVYQISQLLNAAFNQLPQIIQSIVAALEPLEHRLHAASIQVSSMDILTNLAQNIPKPDPTQIIGRMTDVAMSTMTWLFYGLSIVVMSFYFLLDGYRIKESIIRAFPNRHYVSLTLLATDADLSLQAFFRGQIVLGLLFGAFMFCVYAALGIQYALLLGVILGVWEIVPVIGPTIGFIPTIISVALDGMGLVPMNRWGQVLLVVVIFNVFQWLKDNFVAPRYIGNVIGLHPVMIFIAIMIGARLDGMAGVICSLPVACVINVLINHVVLRARAAKHAINDVMPIGEVAANAAAAELLLELSAPATEPDVTEATEDLAQKSA